jgi:monothiol glutaredoxin
MEMSLHERIQRTIQQSDVVLFMKGTRHAPQCGFSAKVVQILDTLVPDYVTVNVLEDPAVRDGIKQYSSWPTIPQLYVRGKFVGGSDIVSDLFADGSLADTLGVEVAAAEAPQLTVTARARAALASALTGSDEVVRLGVTPSFDHELIIGAPQPGDVRAPVEGVAIVLDPMSARRAQGISIDLVESPQGSAFKIDNPNAPPRVTELSVEALEARLAADQALVLVDVRTPAERDLARIEGSRLLDDDLLDELEALDPSTPIAFVCHHGIRSRGAAEHFLAKGFKNVFNVSGGIEAWSARVDPSVPRY